MKQRMSRRNGSVVRGRPTTPKSMPRKKSIGTIRENPRALPGPKPSPRPRIMPPKSRAPITSPGPRGRTIDVSPKRRNQPRPPRRIPTSPISSPGPRGRTIDVTPKRKPIRRKPPIKSPTQPIGIRPPLTGRMTLGSKSQRMY